MLALLVAVMGPSYCRMRERLSCRHPRPFSPRALAAKVTPCCETEVLRSPVHRGWEDSTCRAPSSPILPRSQAHWAAKGTSRNVYMKQGSTAPYRRQAAYTVVLGRLETTRQNSGAVGVAVVQRRQEASTLD